MSNDLSVVDLFCGGGGFSEGFRQAGFEITHAVDWADRAISTYKHNIPNTQNTEVLQRSLLEEIDRDNLPSDVPDDIDILSIDELPTNPDIVVGSPPCTEFSWSKSGGNGDKTKGKSTVSRFFELVAEMDPQYWIMENVPNSESHVREAFKSVDALSLDGDLDQYIHKFDCSNYNTPQRRNRLFFGQFPEPEKPTEDPLTLGQVVNKYISISQKDESDLIEDPLYSITIPKTEVTDCFYKPYLTKREAEDIRLRKEDHSIYGRMSFPDDTGKCSRTIMASDRTLARETIVVKDEQRKPTTGEWEWSPFRKLTIREIATLQGFPITYQFKGDSSREKWRRVGDAVPPTVAYHIAKAVLAEQEIEDCDSAPNVQKSVTKVETNLNGSGTRNRRQIRITRPFRHHIPWDNKRNFRVDLANTQDDLPEHPLSNAVDTQINHPVRFYVILNQGYAKTHDEVSISIKKILNMFSTLVDRKKHLRENIELYIEKLNELGEIIPDATTLQATRTFRKDWDISGWDDLREFEILKRISAPLESDQLGVVDHSFPHEEYNNKTIKFDNLMGGTELPIRVLMKLVAAAYVAYKLNHCGQWIRKNPDKVYLPEKIFRDKVDFQVDINCKPTTSVGCCIETFLRECLDNSESTNSLDRFLTQTVN